MAIGYGATAVGDYAVAIGDAASGPHIVFDVWTNKTTTVTEIPLDDGSVSNAVVEVTEIVTNSSATAVGYAKAAGIHSLALGYMAYAPAEAMGLAYSPDRIYLCSSNTAKNAGATARSLQSYLRYSFKSPSFEEVSIPQTDADGVETSVVTTNGVTCADGYIYDVTVTNGAEGVYFTLPEYASHSQDFIVRLACSDTNGTQIAGWGSFGESAPAEIDWPNGDLMTTGSLKGTNYVTFAQTGANRWRISCYPANKEK